MKHLVYILSALLILSGCQAEVEKKEQIHLHFSTVEEGQKIISTSDHFTQSFHQFDLVSRLTESGLEPAEQSYLDLGRQSVREWSQQDIETLQASGKRLQAIIDSCGYQLPIPDTLTLINTSMVEEGNAAGYTRGKNIFLRLKTCINDNGSYEKEVDYLLAHELFHILSRNSAEFRKAMYQQIGFTVLDHEIEFPDSLLEMRISNPDVNSYDSYSEFTINGEKKEYTMWFFADSEYEKGPFFLYGKPGLVPLDTDHRPIMNEDGSPIIYGIDQAEDFFSRIGKNTGYVINPEEALAENFAFALLDYFPYGNPNPEVTARLREVMKGSWIQK